MTSKLFTPVGLASALLCAAPASACLPPPPGWVEPSHEERVRDVAERATDIVYGVVVRGNEPARFRVIHAYKGSLRPGTVIRVSRGWSLSAPSCPGMLTPPPVSRGDYGVIFFQSDQPQLNFLSDNELQLMFSEGLIRSARAEASSPSEPH